MVQEATNSEAWGPHGQLLSKLADASVDGGEAHAQIVGVLRRRIDHARAHPEKWRNAYKSLLVIEYLVKHGSPRFVDEMRSRRYLSVLETLSKHFEFVDPKDLKDHGISVRNRAKTVVMLLRSPERIKEERSVARNNAGKYSAISSRDAAREGHWSPRGSRGGSDWDSGPADQRGAVDTLPPVKPLSSLRPPESPASKALPEPVRIGSLAPSQNNAKTEWKQRVDPKIAGSILTPQSNASGTSSSLTPAMAANLLENTYNLEHLGLSGPSAQGVGAGQQSAVSDPFSPPQVSAVVNENWPPGSPVLLDLGAAPTAGAPVATVAAADPWSNLGSGPGNPAPGAAASTAAPALGSADWAAFGSERDTLHNNAAGALAEDLFLTPSVPNAVPSTGNTPERGALNAAAALGKDPFSDLGLL